MARANGADVEIPSLHEAKAQFDEWLMSEPEYGEGSNDIMVKRALGLKV